MVADARDGSDDGRGSRAEGFGKFSRGVSGENFVNGDLAFFGGDAHLAKQSQSRVARDAGKNCAAKRWSDGFAVENEENVHDAGFLDVAAFDAVKPEHVVKTFFLSETRGEEATGVIASGFAVARAAGEGADEALFGEQTNRLREVWAHGRSHEDQPEAIGGANDKPGVDAKVSWANVERAALAIGDPIAVEADKFFNSFEEKRFGNFRHGEASRGTI